MSYPLLECVPNFSEGQRPEVIEAIAASIRAVKAVKLLHIDIGNAANRTVMTFAGEPKAVIEAAFQAIKQAAQLIDMRSHTGIHPRMGATDVCPLIPIEGICMEEVIKLSHQLGQRVGEELGIPVYLYEASATADHRKNLATIRKGEYEGFREKILDPAWIPDYGPTSFCKRSGQTVIGARNFLIAYNINLATTSVDLAKKIAARIRESGYSKEVDGRKIRIAGRLKGLKAIGWYVEEYGFAQVSTNIVDRNICPIHTVYETAKELAKDFGTEVIGSELIGLIPKEVLLRAARFYMEREEKQSDDELEIMHTAIAQLGLDQLEAFDPMDRVLSYCLRDI